MYNHYSSLYSNFASIYNLLYIKKAHHSSDLENKLKYIWYIKSHKFTSTPKIPQKKNTHLHFILPSGLYIYNTYHLLTHLHHQPKPNKSTKTKLSFATQKIYIFSLLLRNFDLSHDDLIQCEYHKNIIWGWLGWHRQLNNKKIISI